MMKSTAWSTILGLAALLALPAGLRADMARFQQGVDGYQGTRDMELKGGKAAPKAAAKKKAEAPKEEPSKKETKAAKKPAVDPKSLPVKPTDRSISVDQDNGGVISQAMIRFDGIVGTGPGQVPPGSTVTSATLTVNGVDEGAGKVYVHRVLGDWDEGSLAWESARFGENKEGGLQADGQDATAPFTSFDSKRTGTFEIDVLPAVKLWVAGSAKNQGLALTSDSTNGWDFDSSEAADASKRPVLTVTFTPPPRP